MSRPTSTTVKRLFAISGNRCAFPDCPQELVTSNVVTGEICHIRAQRGGGPRFDPAQTEVDRHSFENLILLCPPHHTVVDQDVQAYPVAKLEQMKREHESLSSSQLALPDDQVVDLLLNINGTVVASLGQAGGQTAHSIVNMYGDAATQDPQHDRWSMERMLSVAMNSVTKGQAPAGYLEFVIQPSAQPCSSVSVGDLARAVRDARPDFAIGFPYSADEPVERQQTMGQTFVAKTTSIPGYVESWSAFRTGYFYLVRIPFEDTRGRAIREYQAGTYLNWLVAIATVGEFLVFASRFLAKIGFSGGFEYEVKFVGMKGRVLADEKFALHGGYRCDSTSVEVSGRADIGEVAKSPIKEGVCITRRLFEMFHWDNPDESVLRSWFEKALKRQL